MKTDIQEVKRNKNLLPFQLKRRSDFSLNYDLTFLVSEKKHLT